MTIEVCSDSNKLMLEKCLFYGSYHFVQSLFQRGKKNLQQITFTGIFFPTDFFSIWLLWNFDLTVLCLTTK